MAKPRIPQRIPGFRVEIHGAKIHPDMKCSSFETPVWHQLQKLVALDFHTSDLTLQWILARNDIMEVTARRPLAGPKACVMHICRFNLQQSRAVPRSLGKTCDTKKDGAVNVKMSHKKPSRWLAQYRTSMRLFRFICTQSILGFSILRPSHISKISHLFERKFPISMPYTSWGDMIHLPPFPRSP